jgi:uncharacterized caspase-like protein
VIGNAAHANAPALRNPPNDARTIADLLRESGFDQVTLKLDLAAASRRSPAPLQQSD